MTNKQTQRKLAILGGAPAFDETLHVGRPNIGDRSRLLERFNEMLDRKWLTNRGPLSKEFEQRLCEFLQVKHCIAVCNATVGLEIATRAAGLKGEVIVPAFTFVATAHALKWQEITPVFCDVDPVSHNIDPDKVEALITPQTTGILGVHLWGRPCDIQTLQAIADRHNLTLMFDAAHAMGSHYGNRPVGGFGLAEVFSFHATKVMNAFEGGAVATNDDDLARKIRLMNNFGFTGLDKVEYIGTNGKMSEPAAAMGLTSLESLDKFVARNRANHHEYQSALENIPGLELISYRPEQNVSHQYVVVETDETQTGISRDEVIKVLHAENVRARRYFYPGCHRMEPYCSLPGTPGEIPVTDGLASKILCLPTGTSVSSEQIRVIGQLLREAIRKSEEIRKVTEYSD